MIDITVNDSQGKISGVIDRIEPNGQVVILIEDHGMEKIVHQDQLPQGITEQTWLQIECNEGQLLLTIDEVKTKQLKAYADERIELLRSFKRID